MKYEIPYGKQKIAIDIPDINIINFSDNKSGYSKSKGTDTAYKEAAGNKAAGEDASSGRTIVEKASGGKKIIEMDIAEKDIIENALLSPVAAKKLKDAAYMKKNVCILVSDITRPCPCLLYTSPSPRDGLLSRMP